MGKVKTFREFLSEGKSTWKKDMYRGVRPKKHGKDYASDPGDLGKGEYWTSNIHYARGYGKTTKKKIRLKNPLHLTASQASILIDRYKTVRGHTHQREKGAAKLSAHFKSRGYDGVVVKGYEGGRDHVTVIKLK